MLSSSHIVVALSSVLLLMGCGDDGSSTGSGSGGAGTGGSSSGAGAGADAPWSATLTGVQVTGLPSEVSGSAMVVSKTTNLTQFTGAANEMGVTLVAFVGEELGVGAYPTTSFGLGFGLEEYNCSSDDATITMTSLDPDEGTFEGSISCQDFMVMEEPTVGTVSGQFRGL